MLFCIYFIIDPQTTFGGLGGRKSKKFNKFFELLKLFPYKEDKNVLLS